MLVPSGSDPIDVAAAVAVPCLSNRLDRAGVLLVDSAYRRCEQWVSDRRIRLGHARLGHARLGHAILLLQSKSPVAWISPKILAPSGFR